MRKERVYTIIGGTILAAILLSGNCFGTNKHIIVKLKGNVLYAGHKVKKEQDKTMAAPAVAVELPKKVSTPQKPLLKVHKNEVVAIAAQPEVKKATRRIAVPPPVACKVNIQERMENIHSQIFEMFPGTYLDSVSFVNQLLSDSIRAELARTNSGDKEEYLKGCLVSSIQDSITLARLNKISSEESSGKYNWDGVLIAHCKDASNSSNVDSVVMDVFSGSTLMASASSDKTGTIQCQGIPEGNYYVVFSRKAYNPFSLMRVKVSNAGQSYIDVPLAKQDGYLFGLFGKNAWLVVTTFIILLLGSMIVSAYYLARYNAKRALRTT